MINNAIHPGEPCGVDASMLLVRDYLSRKKNRNYLKNLVIVIVPVYNIGGAINRNSTTRVNQNGPLSYGFRGNAKNLDLNRDFIKCDSRNAQSFTQLFHKWMPDVFIDNHTSNGADYQYTMTLIATEDAKMDPVLANYMNEKMLPRLYKNMLERDWEMTPYVFARNTPDEGIAAFLDLPRYSSGYAALFDCISFMPETHMLKPYKDRVESTYAFMDSMIKLLDDDHEVLKKARQQAIKNTKRKNNFDVNWTLDTEQQSKLSFKGYRAAYKLSEISGEDRLYYDRNQPYTKDIPYFDTYKATKTLKRPMAYIIPQAYHKLIERLKWNGVKLLRLTEDFETRMELYRIKDFETVDQPYEGHYLHSKVELDTFQTVWPYYKGDYVVIVNQPTNRYIVETLEPQGPDSFFAWNFFDGILQQKEYFSPYVFEDLAIAYLKGNPELKERLEAKNANDPEFAKNANDRNADALPVTFETEINDLEANKQVVMGFFEDIVNKQDFEPVPEYFTEDWVFHNRADPHENTYVGHEGVTQWGNSVYSMMPDFTLVMDDILMVAEGDLVAVRWTATGTHTGDVPGIPASGNDIFVTGAALHRVRDGKISETSLLARRRTSSSATPRRVPPQ